MCIISHKRILSSRHAHSSTALTVWWKDGLCSIKCCAFPVVAYCSQFLQSLHFVYSNLSIIMLGNGCNLNSDSKNKPFSSCWPVFPDNFTLSRANFTCNPVLIRHNFNNNNAYTQHSLYPKSDTCLTR